MTKAITPGEVLSPKPSKSDNVPDEVLEIINSEIKKHWDGEKAILFVDDLAVTLVSNIRDLILDDVYDKDFFEFKAAYVEAGWRVKYIDDDPDYDPIFKFEINC